jgi:hypothetical protein
MKRVRPAHALLAAALLAGAIAAAPALAKDAPPIETLGPPPSAATAPNGIVLPQRLIAEAAAFQAFLERAPTVSTTMSSAGEVAAALKMATAYEPKALIRGAVAYAAIAALQNTTFVNAVRAAGNSPDNRQLMAGYLFNDPAYALQFAGADGAAGLAKEALGAPGLRLYLAGNEVKLSAYYVQKNAWSKEDIPNRPGRLAAVEAAGTMPLPPADDHVGALLQAESGAAPLPINAGPAQPPYTPLVARAVQLAAMAALGQAGEDAYDRLSVMAFDDTTHTCLHIAKLNLYQCLAVAKPNYEDIFCIGQHGMADTGACLVRNVGEPVPAEIRPTPNLAVKTQSRHAGG